jgi:branched-chain amino acid transport system permease protein
MPRGIADVIQHFKRTGWRYFSENVRTHRL